MPDLVDNDYTGENDPNIILDLGDGPNNQNGCNPQETGVTKMDPLEYDNNDSKLQE